jgi:sigma-B regulation protein RsbU (phosphoserine phosphatase)
MPFVPGDLLALYTDGIPESQDSDGRDYSAKRLHRLITSLADMPSQVIVDRCVEDYTRFRSEDADDITLLVAKRL